MTIETGFDQYAKFRGLWKEMKRTDFEIRLMDLIERDERSYVQKGLKLILKFMIG